MEAFRTTRHDDALDLDSLRGRSARLDRVPRQPRVRPGAAGQQRPGRQASGAHRSRGRCGRRRQHGQPGARIGPGPVDPRRRPQPRRLRHQRRRHRARPRRHEGPPHRSRAPGRVGPARSDRQGIHGRRGGPRSGHPVRRHRVGRHRRADPRRRDRLAGPQVRPGDRRPRGGRDRDRRRPAGHRQRGLASRPVLGGPRRRRQLRCRHPVPVQALPGRRDPRRRAVHAGHPRRPAQPRADRGERAGGADDDLVPDGAPARPVRPGRAGRHDVARDHVRLQRRPGRRPGGPPAVPRRRHAARRHGHADAVSGHLPDARSRPRSAPWPSIARAS